MDACCLGKAYVTAGIGLGKQLGAGPGPVVHTEFPSLHRHFPSVALFPKTKTTDVAAFRKMKPFMSTVEDKTIRMGRVLPVVDTEEWVERLAKTRGVSDIQLRIKDIQDSRDILERVKSCQDVCYRAGVRLWINDYWEAALEAGCFGVHLGQEDLARCHEMGGLDRMREADVALGISTHSYGELAVTLGIRPTYISLGPVYATQSKKVGFDAQGLNMVAKWRQLVPPDTPLVVIGGIGGAEEAKAVRIAGADCAAVIGAVTSSDNVAKAVSDLSGAMSLRDP